VAHNYHIDLVGNIGNRTEPTRIDLGRHGLDARGDAVVVQERGEADRGAADEDLRETCPLNQGIQVGGKALRIRHTNGMEVRRKRLSGFK
jgi:hypothetical protein